MVGANTDIQAYMRAEVLTPVTVDLIDSAVESDVKDSGHSHNHALFLSSFHFEVGNRVSIRTTERLEDPENDDEVAAVLEGEICEVRQLSRHLNYNYYASEFLVRLDRTFPAGMLLTDESSVFATTAEFGRREQYEKLLEESEDIIFLMDTEGVFLSLSKNVEKQTEYRAEDLIGEKIYDFTTEESGERIRRRILRWIGGAKQAERVNIQVQAQDGRIIDLQYVSWPIVIDSQVTYIQGVARDVTQQKSSERIREHTTEIYDKLDDLDSVFERIQDTIEDILKPRISFICLYDEHNGYCVVRSIRGKDIGQACKAIVESHTCPIVKKQTKMIKFKEDIGPFFVESDIDTPFCPNLQNIQATDREGRLMGIPLRTRTDETNSFVCIQFDRSSPLPDETRIALRNFSVQAGSAIESAKLLFLQDIENKLLDEVIVDRDLNDYLDYVIKLICDEIRAEACSIFVKDSEGILRLRATTGIKGDPPRDEVFYLDEEGITGKVARTGEILLIVGSPPEDEDFLNKFTEKTVGGVKRWIGIPINNSKGLTVGVLRCMNRRAKDDFFDGIFFPHDIEALEHVARIIAMVIELSTSAERTSGRLARIEHELLSPIAGMRGNISYVSRHLANHENLSSSSYENLVTRLDDVFEGCEMLKHQARSIMMAIREELTPKVVITNLYRDVFVKCINLVRPLIREKGYSDDAIECSNSLKKLSAVYVDRVQFEEVVYNLLTNALKYSKDARTFKIFLSGRIEGKEGEEGEDCVLLFQDYGIGVRDKDSEGIFLEGFRSSRQARKLATGRGIGLTIVRKIVKAHHGRISLSNNQNPTEFKIVIPKDLSHLVDNEIKEDGEK